MSEVTDYQSDVEVLLRQCEDIRLSEGTLLSVYIGPGGIFVISQPEADPEAIHFALRTMLETGRIRVYAPGSGYFEPFRGLVPIQWDEETLSEQIFEWVFSEPASWDEARIDCIVHRLTFEDSRNRGRHTDKEGNTYVLKSGTFHLASPNSSEVMFYATLFGGTLGLHRFLCGKVFSGLVYLCTGGLLGIGWLLDLLSLFFGVLRDGKKRYYEPLKRPVLKLLALPVGVFVSAQLFLFQTGAMLSLLDALNTYVSVQFRHASPSTVKQLENSIENFFGNYFGGFAK